MTRTTTTVCLAAIAMLSACDDGRAQAGHDVTNVDGVRVVESFAPSWGPNEEWRLSSQPVATIGVVDGAPEYLLDRVVDVTTLSDGTIAVADLGSSRVRLFDPLGRFLSGFGSKGEGPGEFRQPLGLFAINGDSLVVIDRLERLHFFSSAGRFGRTLTFGATPVDLDPITFNDVSLFPRIVGFFGDGSFVTRRSADVRLSADRRLVEVQTPELTFALHSRDGVVLNTMARVPGPSFAPHPANIILPTLFGPEVHAATSSGELVLGVAAVGEVRWIDRSGSVRQTATRPWRASAVTDEMFDAHVTRSAVREELVRGRTRADSLPAFSHLLVDTNGNVWAREAQAGHADLSLQYIRTTSFQSNWFVFAPDGVWMGEVTMPSSFTPLEIGSAYVLGVSRDDFEVERVLRFELLKPGR